MSFPKAFYRRRPHPPALYGFIPQTYRGSRGEADGKITAVFKKDNIYENIKEISELPEVLVERLRHYFTAYKMIRGEDSKFSIEKIYGREFEVLKAAMKDYDEVYEAD